MAALRKNLFRVPSSCACYLGPHSPQPGEERLESFGQPGAVHTHANFISLNNVLHFLPNAC